MIYTIRKANPQDVPAMMALVRELALFEKAPEQVVNTEAMMREDGFGEHPIYRAFVAVEETTQQVVGMALYYTAYSTWKGKMLFLDDLVVNEQHRRAGLGRKLINEMLREAASLGYKQVRWQVLDWNEPAIAFYKSLGAFLDDEWITCKMDDKQIQQYLHTINPS